MNLPTNLDHPTLLALAERLSPSLNGGSSYRLARAAEALHPGGWDPLDEADAKWVATGLRWVSDSRVAFWRDELQRLRGAGIGLVAVGDPSYPSNLLMVHNRPPFLFVRGDIEPLDERAVAVVGTRSASSSGIAAATTIARELAQLGVTVVSGLAEGIDTAAHLGALEANARTIAVFGTGINTVFPARNRDLAERISNSGACVSQFWPDDGGRRWTFPARNLVTSGLSIGTVVVEASDTSGARLQAEEAIRHGKRLFLLRELVTTQAWAREAISKDGVTEVTSVDEVIVAIELELGEDAAVF